MRRWLSCRVLRGHRRARYHLGPAKTVDQLPPESLVRHLPMYTKAGKFKPFELSAISVSSYGTPACCPQLADTLFGLSQDMMVALALNCRTRWSARTLGEFTCFQVAKDVSLPLRILAVAGSRPQRGSHPDATIMAPLRLTRIRSKRRKQNRESRVGN